MQRINLCPIGLGSHSIGVFPLPYVFLETYSNLQSIKFSNKQKCLFLASLFRYRTDFHTRTTSRVLHPKCHVDPSFHPIWCFLDSHDSLRSTVQNISTHIDIPCYTSYNVIWSSALAASITTQWSHVLVQNAMVADTSRLALAPLFSTYVWALYLRMCEGNRHTYSVWNLAAHAKCPISNLERWSCDGLTVANRSRHSPQWRFVLWRDHSPYNSLLHVLTIKPLKKSDLFANTRAESSTRRNR